MNPFGPFYSPHTIVFVVFAMFFYKAAEIEKFSPILWAGISIAVYLFTWLGLGWGYVGNIVGQGILMLGIAVFRVWREK